MNRNTLALGMLLGVLATLALPNLALAAQASSKASVDQSAWTARKSSVQLRNGLRLSYVELGDPRGEPLLLLHGYTDSSRSFSLMAPHLAGYRLIIPDQRGHGGSDAPECCYSTTVFADDARLLLDALGVASADVVGHSLGSMVAMTMAANHPERVRSITLIGSTALAPVARGTWLYDNTRALRSPLDPDSDFMREWHPSNQPTAVDPAFAAAVMDELLAIPLHVWHGVLRELEAVPAARYAADVKAPVLVLSGGRDPLFPAEHHRSLLRAFPGAAAHVFAELGHNPNWERPEQVAAKIRAFLAGRTGQAMTSARR